MSCFSHFCFFFGGGGWVGGGGGGVGGHVYFAYHCGICYEGGPRKKHTK